MSPRIRVIGIGSRLRGDDAFGPTVIARLAESCPAGVEPVEFDGDGAALAELLASSTAAIIVDAIRGEGRPGTLLTRELSPDASDLLPRGEARFSAHGTGLAEALGLCELLGGRPSPLVLVGVEALGFEPGAQLSDPVAAALPAALHAVRRQLARLLRQGPDALLTCPGGPGGARLPCPEQEPQRGSPMLPIMVERDDSAALIQSLGRISMFARLSPQDLEELASSGNVVEFLPDQVLMREGDPGNEAFVILEGTVSVVRSRQEVVQRGPGDCLGELALIDSSPRSATVTAISRVRAVVLRRDDFDQLMTCPAFTKSLLAALSGKVREGDVLIRQASDDLRRLIALKEDLFSLIIHDLRNPLGNLKIAIQFLKGEAVDDTKERLPRLLMAAARSADYMQQLLDDVLDVCRLESGELTPAMESVDLRVLGGEAANILGELAAMRKVHIRVEIGPPCLVTADAKMVRRTLENFLSNALRYCPAESDIEIRLTQEPGYVTVDVADRGPGVPAQFRETVFRKFGTLEMRGGGGRTGYGLGLHLATLVARSHGGSVSVHDNPGGGALFRLTVPVAVP
ncbi:MAG: hydrogenase maturation protease [Candidatus Wallbacteria bacterium]|nr:hydrogenase maturation protease [Candidatus Wallbacteria bacterium]